MKTACGSFNGVGGKLKSWVGHKGGRGIARWKEEDGKESLDTVVALKLQVLKSGGRKM